jgi:HNH/ENDO VII superfamily nuclease with conserved GHE residues
MWDLTVTRDHDFYIQAATTTILVHNCGPGNGGAAPEDAGAGAADEAPDVTQPRPSFRKGTIKDAWDNAEDGPGGGKLCPTCGDEVNVEPGTGPRDWDIDHQPPWSQRIPELGEDPDLTRGDVIDNYQEGTRLECPACNRGRGATPAW